MNSIEVYWKRVRAVQATLPDPCWLTDRDGKGMSEASAECGAEEIVKGDSRLATDLEIAMFKARRSVLDSQYRDAVTLRNRGGFRLEAVSE